LSALLQAVSFEHLDIVTILLDAGADIDGATYHGSTPLMVAAAGGNLPIVRLLVERGAALHRRDSEGWNAWACAAEKCEEAAAAFLIEAGVLPEFPAVHD
jgi:uncharacterized protein